MMKKLALFIVLFCSIFTFAQQKSIFDLARNGTLEEMKSRIKDQPNSINTIDENGYSPLILACYRGNIEVANYLIDSVKDLDYVSHQGTALAALSINYNKELVLKMLNKKANPNIADQQGYTPLIWAVKSAKVELVAILLKYGADKTLKDLQGISAFEYALTTKNKEVISLLKKNNKLN